MWGNAYCGLATATSAITRDIQPLAANIGEANVDNEPQDTTGVKHHSQKRLKIITVLVGVGGAWHYLSGSGCGTS